MNILPFNWFEQGEAEGSERKEEVADGDKKVAYKYHEPRQAPINPPYAVYKKLQAGAAKPVEVSMTSGDAEVEAEKDSTSMGASESKTIV